MNFSSSFTEEEETPYPEVAVDPDTGKISYAVSPGYQDWVFISACIYMAVTCFFGVILNFWIIFLFIGSPLVRKYLLADL